MGIKDTRLRVKELKQFMLSNKIESKNIVFEIIEKDIIENNTIFEKLSNLYSNIRFAVKFEERWDNEKLKLLVNPGISYIKIGMELTRDVDRKSKNKNFIKTLGSKLKNKNIPIIAEGIQSDNEHKILTALGVKYGQGYLFAKPEALFSEFVISIQNMKDPVLRKKMLASIYHKRGKEYFNKREFDKAILAFSKVLEIDAFNLESLFYRCFAYCEEGGVAAADNDLERILKIEPESLDIFFLKGLLHEKRGRIDEAIESYSEYINRVPTGNEKRIESAKKRITILINKVK